MGYRRLTRRGGRDLPADGIVCGDIACSPVSRWIVQTLSGAQVKVGTECPQGCTTSWLWKMTGAIPVSR